MSNNMSNQPEQDHLRFSRRATIGASLVLALEIFVLGFSIYLMSQGNVSTAGITTIATSVIAVVLAAVGFIMIQRKQVLKGLNFIYYGPFLTVFTITLFFEGRALSAGFSLGLISLSMINWVYPRESRRLPVINLAIFYGWLIVLEMINPAFREPLTATSTNTGIIIGIVFVIIVGIYVVRETWGRSLRNKLIVAFIGITLVVTAALGIPVITESTRFLEENLERELTTLVVERATSVGNLLNEQIKILSTLALSEVLQQAAEAENYDYPEDASAIQAVLDSKDAQWRAADEADNNLDPLVREYLTNNVARELIEFQANFPNHSEVFITDQHGGLAGTTNRTSDYYQADEDWWQAAYNNGQGAVYVSNPVFDESANVLAIQIALPLRNRLTGDLIGILRTTYELSALKTILGEAIGETGSLDLFIPGEEVVHYHEGILEDADPGLFEQLQEVRDQGLVELVYEGELSVASQAPVQTLEGNTVVDNLDWIVAFHQHRGEAFTQIEGQTQGVVFTSLIIIPLAILAAFGLALFLVRPITQLTKTAEEVAAGNLSSRANVTTTDEIGTLASTFNSMTSQLQETLQGLEQRVAARTRDLAIVAEVGTATSSIQETKRLLQEVVDLTKERFNLYHSHIYLLDEKGENLVLTAGAGEPGRIMVKEGRSIPLIREQSLVARAARERKGVTVNDVTQAPDHLPNPLLPDTRSELAVPMIVGGNLIGIFDIQSDQVGRFTESDINIQTTLAAQLAVSIQNVRSFERSKREAELQSLVNVIGSRIQRATSIEETLQTAIRELGTAIGASRVKASIQSVPDDDLQTVAVEPAEPILSTKVENSTHSTEPEDVPAE